MSSAAARISRTLGRLGRLPRDRIACLGHEGRTADPQETHLGSSTRCRRRASRWPHGSVPGRPSLVSMATIRPTGSVSGLQCSQIRLECLEQGRLQDGKPFRRKSRWRRLTGRILRECRADPLLLRGDRGALAVVDIVLSARAKQVDVLEGRWRLAGQSLADPFVKGEVQMRYERKLWMRDLVMGVAYPPVDH